MRADSFVAGVFGGMLLLCVLMLALPTKKICEVSLYRNNGKTEHVHVGFISKYED